MYTNPETVKWNYMNYMQNMIIPNNLAVRIWIFYNNQRLAMINDTTYLIMLKMLNENNIACFINMLTIITKPLTKNKFVYLRQKLYDLALE